MDIEKVIDGVKTHKLPAAIAARKAGMPLLVHSQLVTLGNNSAIARSVLSLQEQGYFNEDQVQGFADTVGVKSLRDALNDKAEEYWNDLWQGIGTNMVEVFGAALDSMKTKPSNTMLETLLGAYGTGISKTKGDASMIEDLDEVKVGGDSALTDFGKMLSDIARGAEKQEETKSE